MWPMCLERGCCARVWAGVAVCVCEHSVRTPPALRVSFGKECRDRLGACSVGRVPILYAVVVASPSRSGIRTCSCVRVCSCGCVCASAGVGKRIGTCVCTSNRSRIWICMRSGMGTVTGIHTCIWVASSCIRARRLPRMCTHCLANAGCGRGRQF